MSNKFDVLNNISTQMKEVLKIQNEKSKSVFVTTNANFEILRENYIEERKFWNEDGFKPFKIENRQVTSDFGAVNIRLYYPNNRISNAAIFYIHGGGFVVGNLNTHDRIMRIICEKSDSIVIGIDYSLSPEAKYPQAIKECASVVKYIRDNGKELSVDINKLGIAGDSGGANLAIATTLYIRDKIEPTPYIKALLLFYGLYGLRDSMAIRMYGGLWDGLERKDLEYYAAQYTRNEQDFESPYYNIFNADLSKSIPPCYICSAEYDPLIDDSELLHRILTMNKLDNEYYITPGVIHGFLHYSKILDSSLDVMVRAANYFKKQL